jgi:glycosyltransferase involved in cell wall biosynthesis
MKKVLIISYYFPPMGMGGVQRALKFAKYLPSFGWQPIILTVKDVDYFARDYTLLDELSSDVKIIRTGSLDPLRLSYLLKKTFGRTGESRGETYTPLKAKVLSWLFLPDNKIGWVPFALNKGLEACKERKIDLIFSTSPPPSVHLIGYLLKKLTGKVWIVDFRDGWIGYHYQLLPTPLHRFAKKVMMNMITTNCDGIVAVNQEIAEPIRKQLPLSAKPLEVIPNGFDRSDFTVRNLKKTARFTITYLGTFSLDNDPQPFFRALSNLLNKGKIGPGKLKLTIAGLPLGIDLGGLIQQYNLQECVENLGYLPHLEATQKLIESDLLLLTISGSPESRFITTGKLFEYLAAQKPILAIAPKESAAAQMVQSTKSGTIISPQEIDQIEETIFSYYENYYRNEIHFQGEERMISQFERKYLTSQLVSLFEEVLKTTYA